MNFLNYSSIEYFNGMRLTLIICTLFIFGFVESERSDYVEINYQGLTQSMQLSDFLAIATVAEFGEHNDCDAKAGDLECEASCRDDQNCLCESGTHPVTGSYCSCSCEDPEL